MTQTHKQFAARLTATLVSAGVTLAMLIAVVDSLTSGLVI